MKREEKKGKRKRESKTARVGVSQGWTHLVGCAMGHSC
jgi:hypothetical protein